MLSGENHVKLGGLFCGERKFSQIGQFFTDFC